METTDRLKKLLEEEKQKNLLLNKALRSEQNKVKKLQSSSDDHYRTVVEFADDIIFKTDMNGKFTYVNPAAEKNVGYTKKELTGMFFLSIIHDDYKEEILQAYSQQLSSKTNSSYHEFPVVTKSGSIIWVGQKVQPIVANNVVQGFTAIARNITERIKSQDELLLLNTRFESMFNNLNAGLVLEDEHRRVIMVNQKLCDIFLPGIKQGQMVGVDFNAAMESMKSFFVEGEALLQYFDQCIENKVISLSWEVVCMNGCVYSCDYIPIFVGEKYTGHLWKYRDITGQVNSRRLLQQNEEKYRLIIENMNLGLLVVDNNGMIVDTNPSFSEMTGYCSEELIGKSVAEIFSLNDRKELLNEIGALRKKGISNAYELQLYNKKGEEVWMLISGSPIFDSQNNVTGSIGIHLDITERKKQMTELIDARHKAEQSARSKEMFLANMSHEIRTPMNVIQGMARLLDDAGLQPKYREYVNAIRISSENLLVIINDILDFSKIDLEKMELEERDFSLHSLINSSILQFELKALEKNISLSKEIDPAIGDVFSSDPVRLSQVLTNLIGNSLKFTSEGRVGLKCKLVEDTAGAQIIEFSVSDTGIGIDESKRETIFESFVQENSSINRKYGGTGLGLSISRQLVRLFGGDLQLESKKGEGSTFSFRIKLKKGDPVVLEPVNEAELDVSRLKGKSVLLVEDNRLNQFLATIILERFEMNVTLANNGYEAIELLLDHEFDVILMDLQMPGIDGLAATFMIRTKLRCHTPIIALTANAIIGDKEKCISAGMNDYVSKPFNKKELALKIMQVMEKPTLIQLEQHNQPSVEPVYNLKKLSIDALNNETFIKTMLELFCDLARETIQNIDKALSDKNYELIRGYVHKIKSSIDTLEINELKSNVREIEMAENISDDAVLQKITHFKSSLSYIQLLIKKNELAA